MKTNDELVFSLQSGIDSYSAPLASLSNGDEFPLTRTINLNFRKGALTSQTAVATMLASAPSSTGFVKLASYLAESDGAFWIYVLGTNLHVLRGSGTSLTLAQIGSLVSSYDSLPSTASWSNAAYITSLQFKPKRCFGSSVTDVNFGSFGEIYARYVLSADDRVFYANVVQNGSRRPYRIIFSDLYNPNDFTLSQSSEAGSYDVGFADYEITGLSFQRGVVNIYTKNSLYQARYVGIQAGIYEFDTLYSGIGCRHHNAVVRGKEVDFFVGVNDIYILDGTQLHSIGTRIFSFYQATFKNFVYRDALPGFHNEAESEVYWQYIANGTNGTTTDAVWEIVYNYRDDKWTSRSSRGFVDVFASKFETNVGRTWAELTENWSALTPSWNELKEFLNIDAFYLTSTSLVKGSTVEAALSYELETFDYVLGGSFFSEKELDSIKIVCSGSGMFGSAAKAAGHDLQLRLGTRDSFHEGITWSSWKSAQDEKDAIYDLGKFLPGKLLRFQIKWTNSSTYHVKQLIALALRPMVPISHAQDR